MTASSHSTSKNPLPRSDASVPEQTPEPDGVEPVLHRAVCLVLQALLELPARLQRLLLCSLDLGLRPCLDGLLLDDPQQLVLVHRYDDEPAEDFLIQEFFGTDFSRCYLALTTLKRRDPAVLWPLLWQRWQEEAHNDYGAHYFFIRLWAALSPWPESARGAWDPPEVNGARLRSQGARSLSGRAP